MRKSRVTTGTTVAVSFLFSSSKLSTIPFQSTSFFVILTCSSFIRSFSRFLGDDLLGAGRFHGDPKRTPISPCGVGLLSVLLPYKKCWLHTLWWSSTTKSEGLLRDVHHRSLVLRSLRKSIEAKFLSRVLWGRSTHSARAGHCSSTHCTWARYCSLEKYLTIGRLARSGY